MEHDLSHLVENAPVPTGYGTGLEPRDYGADPVGTFAPEFPASELVDESEWEDRLNENRKNKAGLLDVRKLYFNVLRSLNQGRTSLCWNFSTTKACMYANVIMGQVDGPILSPWYLAGLINGWRDHGGFGARSMAAAISNGIPALDKCPRFSQSAVAPDAAADAATRKVTEWWEGADDPRLAQRQLVSMLLKKVPCVVDLNAMRHSMCAIDLASVKPVKVIYDNSWNETQTPDGLYLGSGAYASPNGLVIPRVMMG